VLEVEILIRVKGQVLPRDRPAAFHLIADALALWRQRGKLAIRRVENKRGLTLRRLGIGHAAKKFASGLTFILCLLKLIGSLLVACYSRFVFFFSKERLVRIAWRTARAATPGGKAPLERNRAYEILGVNALQVRIAPRRLGMQPSGR